MKDSRLLATIFSRLAEAVDCDTQTASHHTPHSDALHLNLPAALLRRLHPMHYYSIGSLLRELPWRRQVGISGKLAGDSGWLFPGRQAGRPQHPEYLRARLAKIGVECRSNRNAALLQLAQGMPASVLADTLGLHPNTAMRWVDRAGGNWTGYAAQRWKQDRSTEEGMSSTAKRVNEGGSSATKEERV